MIQVRAMIKLDGVGPVDRLAERAEFSRTTAIFIESAHLITRVEPILLHA